MVHPGCASRDLTCITLPQIVSPTLSLRYEPCPNRTSPVPKSCTTETVGPTLAREMTAWGHPHYPRSWPRQLHQASPCVANHRCQFQLEFQCYPHRSYPACHRNMMDLAQCMRKRCIYLTQTRMPTCVYRRMKRTCGSFLWTGWQQPNSRIIICNVNLRRVCM